MLVSTFHFFLNRANTTDALHKDMLAYINTFLINITITYMVIVDILVTKIAMQILLMLLHLRSCAVSPQPCRNYLKCFCPNPRHEGG